jgi:hypothetical protein
MRNLGKGAVTSIHVDQTFLVHFSLKKLCIHTCTMKKYGLGRLFHILIWSQYLLATYAWNPMSGNKDDQRWKKVFFLPFPISTLSIFHLFQNWFFPTGINSTIPRTPKPFRTSIPKIPTRVYFGGPWNGKCWYILLTFGIFYGHLVYFMAIWYILCPLGIFYGHLVYFMPIGYILCPLGIFYGHLV